MHDHRQTDCSPDVPAADVSQRSRKILVDSNLFACAQGNSDALISSSLHSQYNHHHYSDKSSL